MKNKLVASIFIYLLSATALANRCLDHIDQLVEKNHLQLASCKLREEHIPFITDYLNKHPHIDSLDLNTRWDEGNNIISAQAIATLIQTTHLKRLSVQDNKIDSKGALTIASAIMTSDFLEELYIDHNKISDVGVIAFAQTKLKVLGLAETQITSASLAALAEMDSLNTLDVSYNDDLTDDGLIALAKNKSIQKLYISFINSKNISGTGLSEILKNEYTHLSLAHYYAVDGFQLDKENVYLLSQNKKLLYLDLDGCRIGDEGLAILASNQAIETLHLNHNEITLRSVPFLSRMTSLIQLDINGFIGDEGAIALAQLPHLIKLDIGGSHVTDKGVRALALANRLIELNITNNPVGDDGLLALAVNSSIKKLDALVDNKTLKSAIALSKNTTIEELAIDFLDADKKQCTECVIAISKMPKLRKLWLPPLPISHNALEALANSNIKDLTLDVVPLSNEDLLILAKSTQLKKLSIITSATEILEEGVIALSNNTTLEWLNLDLNPVSKKAIAALARNQTLIHLIVDEGVRAIKSINHPG